MKIKRGVLVLLVLLLVAIGASGCSYQNERTPAYALAELMDGMHQEGESATADLTITGDDSDYGKLLPKLALKVLLDAQEDGHYMVTRVTNVEEGFPPVVKAIEDYWTMKGWQ